MKSIIYDTGNNYAPHLLVDSNNWVDFGRFEPCSPIAGETVYYQIDVKRQDILVKAIIERMASIGVSPDDESITVTPGQITYKGKTITEFVNGSLRYWLANHTIYTFRDLIAAVKFDMTDKSFLVKTNAWKPEAFVIGVKKLSFRKASGNKKAHTFDFIDCNVSIRSSDAKLPIVKAHKNDVLLAALQKIRSSKQFASYGVPVNFLKVYQMVLTHDGLVRVSFCLKKEDKE